ncbi:MAG: hypothetical protein IK125_03935 [Lachnospiraceae bacterium]|nr:hypothetical protein [Lachnospiraceae bacterium]
MGIVWLILKIIGITLLCILGLVLFLVLVILITPFRYQVNASYHEKPYAEVKFHFWLRAVVARVTFEDKKLLGILRILFIKKKLLEKDFGKKTSEETIEDNGHLLTDQSAQLLADAENFAENMEAKETEALTAESAAESITETTDNTESTDPNKTSSSDEESKEEADEAETAEEAEIAVEDTTEASGIAAKLEGLKAKGEQICKTVTEKKEMVDRYVDFATQEHTKRAAKYVGKKLVKILKSVRPRKCKGYVKYGLRDPKTMGKICGYSGMLYPVYYKAIDVQPVFGADHTIIDGEIEIKGRIILIAIVVKAVPILFKKDCRRVWKDFKKLRNH